MNFETPQTEKVKTKQERINDKIMEADKIQREVDELLDKMPEGELKASLKAKTQELKKCYEEITELIAEEDELDIKK
ncbi:MAG: hypothetical protein WCJ57_01215 [Candidatus Falkowbacteria bacterium]